MFFTQLLFLTCCLAHFVLCCEDNPSEAATSVKWVPLEDTQFKLLKPLKNSYGKKIYIGRTTFIGGTIPGVVFETKYEIIYFTFREEIHKKSDYELLVDPSDELTWVPISEKISDPFLAGHNSEDSTALYVCRVVESDSGQSHGQAFMIGRVSSALEKCSFTSDTVTLQHSTDYEVLVWNHTSHINSTPILNLNINTFEKVLSQPLDRLSFSLGIISTLSVLLMAGGVAWVHRSKSLKGSYLPIFNTDENLGNEHPIKN